jgi:hypothetical protein
MQQERFKITDQDGDILEVRHNYSFGEFSLTLYLDNPSDNDYCGVRLNLEQAKALKGEIERLIVGAEKVSTLTNDS